MGDKVDTRRSCLERLGVVFRAVFGDNELIVTESTSQREIPSWDRGSHLELVAAIEDSFGVRFTTRESWMSGAPTSSVGLLLDLLVPKVERAVQSLRSTIEQAASASERQRLMEAYVQEQLRGLVHSDRPVVDPSLAFDALGLTSLGAVEFCSRLELGLGLKVGPTVIFNFPNLAKLNEFLATRLGLKIGNGGRSSSDSDDRLSNLLEEIADLSEEEAARLLSERSSSGATSNE